MKKDVLANIDFAVKEYNDITITSNKTVLEKEENTKLDFYPEFESLKILEITEDGEYNIDNKIASRYQKIDIKQNVNATIYISGMEKTEAIISEEIVVQENANVYFLVMDFNQSANISRKINVSKNANVKFHVVSMNEKTNNNLVVADLNEEGANIDFKLITIASDEANNKFDVTVNNNAPKTSGNIWQKACAKTNGRNEFFATGFIAKGSDEAKNFQESRVLLLDDAATGDASPLLLIDHYNVEAGHAASVSRVNEEELYYLQSRGIDKKSAEQLMTIAFVRPLIDEIPSEEIRELIMNVFTSKLNKE